MKLGLLIDNINNKSIEEIIDFVGFSKTIVPLIPDLIEYYDNEMNLFEIINHYSDESLDGSEDEVQVHCCFPEHGGSDNHKSARYYSRDRDSGENRESLYCFKCQIRRGAFLTSLHIERHNRDKWSIVDHFKFLEDNSIVFPRYIIEDFDPDKYYTWDAEEAGYKTKVLKIFESVERIRELKSYDPLEWLRQAENLMRNVEHV